MKKNPWLIFGFLVLFFVFMFFVIIVGSTLSLFKASEEVITKNSILVLDLEGIIIDGEKFLSQLKKYRKNKRIKAIIVKVNSPGGVVGASEEIYREIIKTRNKYKKKVIVSASSLMASGAYYAACAADLIFVQKGTLMGSIGVIMEFANLEKLYDWAKIDRFVIKSGKYKDAGSEHRPMRPEEKKLFKNMVDAILVQFKQAIIHSRKMDSKILNQYADGRVFTGEKGIELGFADEIGTQVDAIEKAADMLGLNEGEYDIFQPSKRKNQILNLLFNDENEWAKSFSLISNSILKLKLSGKPLLILPGL